MVPLETSATAMAAANPNGVGIGHNGGPVINDDKVKPPIISREAAKLAGPSGTAIAFNVRDTAKRLNVSEATIWKMIRLGQIKAVRLLGCTRVPDAEIHRVATAA